MINYIFSLPGSRASEYVYDRIRENISLNKNSFILVPEQYSLFAEIKMLDTLGFKAQKYVQVLTFSRLCNMVFSAVGPLRMKYIDTAGKIMIAARALQLLEKELVFFKKNVSQKGFAAVLVSQFSEFKRYGITKEALDEAAKRSKNPVLLRKLSELGMLYNKYNELLNEKNSDTEDNLAIIIHRLKNCDFLNGQLFAVHFKSFTPLEYDAVFELMKKMDITFSFVSDNSAASDTAFRSVSNTVKKINEFAEKNGIKTGRGVFLTEDEKHKNNSELLFLKDNFLRLVPDSYKEKPRNIHLIRSATFYDETDAAARRIINLCRTKGYSFDDFLILTADSENYNNIIQVVFEKYKINFFMNAKKTLLSYPFARFISYVLEILAKGYSFERVMNCIRCGFFGISKYDEDVFENYLLASGVLSKPYVKQEDFTYNPDERQFDLKAVNSVKNRIIDKIIDLEKSIKGRKTAKQISTALWRWIDKSGVRRVYENKLDECFKKADMDEAKLYEAVWNGLQALFAQLEELFKDDFMTYTRFYEIFCSAAGSVKIGTAPTLLNQVQVLDLDSFVFSDAKVVMILGVSEESFPKSFSEDGIISDSERLELKEEGIVLAPLAFEKQCDERFLVYMSLTSPKDSLWLFSPMANEKGEALDAGEVFFEIKKMFPLIEEEFTDSEDEILSLEGGHIAFEKLYEKLFQNGGSMEGISPLWQEVYEYFKKDDMFLQKMDKINLLKDSLPVTLSRQMAESLYGKPLMLSVSRLEKYNACAFSYFLTYGLFIDERKKASFEANDIGTALHDTLCKYFERKEKEEADYSLITFNEVKKDTAKIVDESADLKKSALYETSAYYRYVLMRIKSIAAICAWKIVSFYKNSSFRPFGFEIKIGSDGIFPPYTITLKNTEAKIRGFIDRMDISEIGGKKYFNIVDYKSSEKKIDLELARLGVRFQPLLYAKIVKDNIKNSEPFSMLYMKMDDPVTEFSKRPESLEHDLAVMKEIKTEGLVLGEENVIKELDYSWGQKDAFHYIPESKNSRIDEKQMDELLDGALKTAEDTAERIASGEIEAQPLSIKSFDACKYCKFSSCCKINKN